jgi:hypothetical protein
MQTHILHDLIIILLFCALPAKNAHWIPRANSTRLSHCDFVAQNGLRLADLGGITYKSCLGQGPSLATRRVTLVSSLPPFSLMRLGSSVTWSVCIPVWGLPATVLPWKWNVGGTGDQFLEIWKLYYSGCVCRKLKNVHLLHNRAGKRA